MWPSVRPSGTRVSDRTRRCGDAIIEDQTSNNNWEVIVRIMAFGKDMSGNLLFPPVDEDQFAASLASALGRNAPSLRNLTRVTASAVAFREEVTRRVIDAGDPLQAGWTFLVAEGDPHKADIIEALRPLALHRGMSNPSAPLSFAGEAEEQWGEWLQDNLFAKELVGERVPQYILMVGNPSLLPFKLQSLLGTFANVGRVDFDRPGDLVQYVDKITRLETAPDPVVKREVVLFAPDGGTNDPTYFSREYMVSPLTDYIGDELGFHTTALTAHDATKHKLVQALRKASPALVYTASHGLGATNQPLEQQKRYNGAICCQTAGELTLKDLFTGDDVPSTEPFLEGSVFFQFACFGYGTPAQSDYAHWLQEVPEKYADEDFTAALPRRLIAHPRGPVAYVGHLDTAFLHGFANQNEPRIADRWHTRIEPFVAAVQRLLQVQPSGLAMQDMNRRFSLYNAMLTDAYDQQQCGAVSWTPQSTARFVDRWIIRSDAQNYMVFGDPAARLRIPAA